MAKSSSTSSLWESLLSGAAWHLTVCYCLTPAHFGRRTNKVGYVIGSPDWFTQKSVDPSTRRKTGSREARSNQSSINVHVFITLHTAWIQERPFPKCNGSRKGRFSFNELALRMCFYHLWSLLSIKLHCEENLTLNLINFSLGKSSQWEMKDAGSDSGEPKSMSPSALLTLSHPWADSLNSTIWIMHLQISKNPCFMTINITWITKISIHVKYLPKRTQDFYHLYILFKLCHKDDKNKFCMRLSLRQNEKLSPGSPVLIREISNYIKKCSTPQGRGREQAVSSSTSVLHSERVIWVWQEKKSQWMSCKYWN